MTSADKSSGDWIELQDPKQWSRLLYPNPVCFLTTTLSSNNCSNNDDAHDNNETRLVHQQRNVMVVSWLTALNNEGHLILSINRRRGTHSALQQVGSSFGLSVPVDGMQEMILEVGSRKAKFGSKFTDDYSSQEKTSAAERIQTEVSSLESRNVDMSSTRQKRKIQRMTLGVEGLKAVDFQGEHCVHSSNEQSDKPIFFVEGTVVFISCQVDAIMENDDDDDHSLIRARVTRARVHPLYWNQEKYQFIPQSPQAPPYLTFLGSQTFGKVIL